MAGKQPQETFKPMVMIIKLRKDGALSSPLPLPTRNADAQLAQPAQISLAPAAAIPCFALGSAPLSATAA